ncbi:haloacid dehalogenase superfamily, subfamily IA, variant 1 with third motif having Dx(3-4)D or Dx(3-4)E [Streptomyces sp. 2112.3]|uniref:HAD family hydrolase n=1 Tax=Streptomyces sp. 2112.3 TaxID=1881023 RepID=UPI00089653A3|nr:HAD family hydrolase [Streptomyces sp. 2112.3]SED95767.1 haloacid dehalogenase superfamily, subfamily IA, variant 1 with third motif having Dx(3-4)D or Dx(3-4)E [Streptomyces sp. 2112.3]
MIRAVAFDVGETLIRDDRGWGAWADWLGVNRHTLSALVGAVVAQGRDNSDALRLVRPGIDIEAERAAMERAGQGEFLDESDLYPDVRPSLAALRTAGMRVVVAGNQTTRAGELLRALELPLDGLATSGEWGVAKPAPEFFARVVELAGVPAGEVLYVGDHPQNDVRPAHAAGLRAAHLRRGPLGHLWAESEAAQAADYRLVSLAELVDALSPR